MPIVSDLRGQEPSVLRNSNGHCVLLQCNVPMFVPNQRPPRQTFKGKHTTLSVAVLLARPTPAICSSLCIYLFLCYL